MDITLGSRFVLEADLGSSSIGAALYQGAETGTGRPVDIRSAPPAEPGRPNARAWLRHEAEILRRMSSPNVPALLAFEDNGSEAVLVTERADGYEGCPTLQEWVQSLRVPLPGGALRRTAGGVVAAVAHLHGRGFIHGNLHAGAFRLRADGSAVLSEFLFARYFKHVTATPPRGSKAAPAPELRAGEPISYQTDLYALGALLYRLATAGGDAPAGSGPGALAALRPDLPPGFSRLVLQLLATDPAARGQSSDLVIAWDNAMAGVASEAPPGADDLDVTASGVAGPAHQSLPPDDARLVRPAAPTAPRAALPVEERLPPHVPARSEDRLPPREEVAPRIPAPIAERLPARESVHRIDDAVRSERSEGRLADDEEPPRYGFAWAVLTGLACAASALYFLVGPQ